MAVEADRHALKLHRPGDTWLRAWRFLFAFAALLFVAQSLIVVQARPQDLVTGVGGMADFLRRSLPPDFSQIGTYIWPTFETVDIAFFGTMAGVLLALPLAVAVLWCRVYDPSFGTFHTKHSMR